MALMDAIRTAQASLGIVSKQTAIVSTNVGRAGDEGYARRDAPTVTDLSGARLARVRRAHDEALTMSMLTARSAASTADTIASELDRLQAMHGGPEGTRSPAAGLERLKSALQTYAAEPSSGAAASGAVAAANELTGILNDVGDGVVEIRSDADAAIGEGIIELERHLERFGELNAAIVEARRNERDSSDAEDARADVLRRIGDLVQVHATERDHGNIMLTAGSSGGPVLFETVPRPVAFAPSGTLDANTVGKMPSIDGIALDQGVGGRIGGLLRVRDEIAPEFGQQADAIAAALVSAFADRDPNGTIAPAPGLFVDPAVVSPALSSEAGLAGRISVSDTFDPATGGDPRNLRDGQPAGPAASRNPGRASGFAGLLIERIEGLDTPRAFPTAPSLGPNVSLIGAASEHGGWLAGERSRATAVSESASGMLTRAEEALANDVGVNIDEEMTRLLELEQAYQASARVIAAADAMLNELLALAR